MRHHRLAAVGLLIGVALTCPACEQADGQQTGVGAESATPVRLSSESAASLATLHARHVMHFKAAPDFGNGRMATFKSEEWPYGVVKLAERTYRIASVKLVGLLNDDEPRVYLSPTMPRMTGKNLGRSRSADSAELTALASLQAGEKTVLWDNAGQRFALGPIHADRACMKCHEVPDRTMLGAFLYTLKPDDGDPPRWKPLMHPK